MPSNKQEPSRLELYQAGKLDERRSKRPAHLPEVKVAEIETEEEQTSIRPTALILGLMVIVLLVLAATSI